MNNAKEAILNKLKNKIPVKESFKAPDAADFINEDPEGLLHEYITRANENKAICKESTNLIADINEIIAKEGVKNLIYPENFLPINIDEVKIDNKFAFNQDISTFRKDIFSYDVSIIKAKKAVSSHGAFMITSCKEQPRTLSLTPKLAIVLIDKKDIVRSLSQALSAAKNDNGGRFPTNCVFILGPSRTSDIEFVPVLGVHGSQIVYVLVY